MTHFGRLHVIKKLFRVSNLFSIILFKPVSPYPRIFFETYPNGTGFSGGTVHKHVHKHDTCTKARAKTRTKIYLVCTIRNSIVFLVFPCFRLTKDRKCFRSFCPLLPLSEASWKSCYPLHEIFIIWPVRFDPIWPQMSSDRHTAS